MRPFKHWIPEYATDYISSIVKKIRDDIPLTLGLEDEFINMYKNRFGIKKDGILFSSGASALEALLLHLKPKNVAIPALAFPGDLVVIEKLGINYIIFDVDESLQASEESLEKVLKRFKVDYVLYVSNGGWIKPNVEGLIKLCEDFGCKIIEDFSHSHGARSSKPAGEIGHHSFASLGPTKPITMGEGGIVFSDEIEKLKKIRYLGLEGFEIKEVGISAKPSTLQIAMGIVSLMGFEEQWRRREEIAKRYREELVEFREPPREGKVSNYKFCLLVKNGEKVEREMKKRGIQLPSRVYPKSLGEMRWAFEDENARKLSRSHVCLPNYYDLKEEEQERIIRVFKELAEPL